MSQTRRLTPLLPRGLVVSFPQTGGGEHARPREEGVRGPGQRWHPGKGALRC